VAAIAESHHAAHGAAPPVVAHRNVVHSHARLPTSAAVGEVLGEVGAVAGAAGAAIAALAAGAAIAGRREGVDAGVVAAQGVRARVAADGALEIVLAPRDALRRRAGAAVLSRRAHVLERRAGGAAAAHQVADGAPRVGALLVRGAAAADAEIDVTGAGVAASGPVGGAARHAGALDADLEWHGGTVVAGETGDAGVPRGIAVR